MPVWEVFSQQDPAGAFIHAGSVEAPNLELARLYARNSFARRDEAFRLWLAPREAISEVTDPDLLRPPGDHRYRSGRFYRTTVDKRKRLKARFAQETRP